MKLPRIKRNERGAALILVALGLVSTVTVTGLVVDGGRAFSARRQMQNSADAAALAGARALDKYQTSTGTTSGILAAVTSVAVSNGATASMVTCRLTDEVLGDVGACPTSNIAISAIATGVHVVVGATSPTSFMKVVGRDSFTAGASATAQIQGLRSGNSPFVLCATGDTDPRSIGDGQAVPIIFPDNSMNHGQLAPVYPTAIGREYELQDPTTIGCGQGNAFKGLSENASTSYPTPGVWDLLNGDHGINVAKSVIAGNSACTTGVVHGCVLAIPLCHAATPPVSGELYCERFGAFQIVDTGGSSRLGGILLATVLATGGQGGGRPEAGELRLIKLSE